MKNVSVFALVALATMSGAVDPLGKVFELIEGLKNKVVADGEREEVAFHKYMDYCGKSSKNVQYEIGQTTSLSEKLAAKVTELSSSIEVADSKTSDLAAAISKAEAELKGATDIRKTEAEEFKAGEKELMSTVDTLERALSTLEKQLSSGASFAQLDTKTLSNLVQTLSVLDDAAAMDGTSMDTLTALVQSHEDDGDLELGAPAAAAHQKQSGGIMEALEDLKDKAEGQLTALRSNEVKAKNSYELLRQGLTDEIAAETKELQDTKSGMAEAAEAKAGSEGNLVVAKKELVTSAKKNSEVQSSCQVAAGDHEANTAARKEELKVLAMAEKILSESTGAADAASSFLQTGSSSHSRQRSKTHASDEVIGMVQQLAKQHHSGSLAQLASRISAVLRYGAAGHRGDPFKKVSDLIGDMIAKLEKSGNEEATEKAYCDEEISKTKAKKGELEDIVEKLEAKVGKSVSQSSSLKQEVSDLMGELAALTKEQAAMDQTRRETGVAHSIAKTDLEKGLGGVRNALSLLRDYYGGAAALIQSDANDDSMLQEDGDSDHDNMSALMQQATKAGQPAPPNKVSKSSGAGQGIIGLLEVCESDLAKNLATEDAEESDSLSSYEKQTQMNKITKVQKEQDAKFKTQEFKRLDKAVSEMQADKATENDELTAVNEYNSKIKARCVAKPTAYEQLKARRDSEIAGLKEAMVSLESAALMQQGARGHHNRLRGDSLRVD